MVTTSDATKLQLSPAMANVLMTMIDWDLWRTGGDDSFWFRKKFSARSRTKPKSSTVLALKKRKLVKFGADYPATRVHLTPTGRTIAAELKAANR